MGGQERERRVMYRERYFARSVMRYTLCDASKAGFTRSKPPEESSMLRSRGREIYDWPELPRENQVHVNESCSYTMLLARLS